MVQDGFYAELKRYGLSKADVQRDAFYRDGLKEGIDIGIKEGKDLGIKEGIDIGIKEGKDLGIKEGIDIGIKEGIDIGIKEGKSLVLATAVNMVKKLGIDPETAAQTAQIPVETLINALQSHEDK
jgi:flagellar biosynthesis/type III secretory pathway protein FliH